MKIYTSNTWVDGGKDHYGVDGWTIREYTPVITDDNHQYAPSVLSGWTQDDLVPIYEDELQWGVKHQSVMIGEGENTVVIGDKAKNFIDKNKNRKPLFQLPHDWNHHESVYFTTMTHDQYSEFNLYAYTIAKDVLIENPLSDDAFNVIWSNKVRVPRSDYGLITILDWFLVLAYSYKERGLKDDYEEIFKMAQDEHDGYHDPLRRDEYDHLFDLFEARLRNGASK
jgi:hypothetical protein